MDTADGEERLPVGLAAAEGKDFEAAGEGIEFAAHETVRPVLGHADGLLEQSEGAVAIGAAQEDNLAGGEVPRNPGWRGRAFWRRFDAFEVA